MRLRSVINIRPPVSEDLRIVSELSGQSMTVIIGVFERADDCWIGEADGEFVCAWGVQRFNMITGDSVIWMYAGPKISAHRTAFLRRNRAYCKYRATISDLYAFVDQRFTVSRHWIEWLGFVFKHDTVVDGLAVAVYKFEG